MSTPKIVPDQTRPAWHSDAKWVVGILTFIVIAVTAFVMSAVKLTERETAVELIATVTATMFSPNGLDDPGDVEKVRVQLKANPNKSIEVLPGVSVTAADVGNKSPRELRLMIFRKLAEPIYDGGTLANDAPVSASSEAKGALAPTADSVGLLVLLSNESHQKLLGIQSILIVASVVLLALLILFSTGFGRLASPGWVLALVSVVPTILIFLITLSLDRNPPQAPVGEPSLSSAATIGAAAVAPIVLSAVRSIYQPMLIVGMALVLIATIVGPLVHLWQRHRRARTSQ